jgi:hypothetical protein
MPEWLIGPVSKTGVPLWGTVGSNPSLSARKPGISSVFRWAFRVFPFHKLATFRSIAVDERRAGSSLCQANSSRIGLAASVAVAPSRPESAADFSSRRAFVRSVRFECAFLNQAGTGKDMFQRDRALGEAATRVLPRRSDHDGLPSSYRYFVPTQEHRNVNEPRGVIIGTLQVESSDSWKSYVPLLLLS